MIVRPNRPSPAIRAARRRRAGLVLLALVAGVSLLWKRLGPPPAAESGGVVESSPAAASASANRAAPTAPAPGLSSAPVEEAADDPAAAHRLRALTFVMDGAGLRLVDSQEAAGRAKAPPRSVASARLEFEAYDAAGALLYSGSVDHPLRRRYEVEDTQTPGRLRAVNVDLTSGTFQVRLPSELPVGRIVFAEIVPAAAAGAPPVRRPLAEFVLP